MLAKNPFESVTSQYMKNLFCILTAVLLLAGCQSPEKKSITAPTAPTKSVPTVAISLPPYSYFVKKIAGETVQISPIVPPQSNPHLFEPTPKQVQDVQEAKLWIRSHEVFEDKIIKVLHEQTPDLSILDLGATLPEEEEDRHIWLSPKLAQGQAQAITEALIQLLPENKEIYQENLEGFIEELQALDTEISNKLNAHKDEAILTSHPAFAFFCKDYGLIQLAIECEGKDPLPQDLENTLAAAKAHKIARILSQPQYNNRGAELIAEHLNLPVSSIDPYSNDYIDMLRQITQLIANDSRSP